MQALALSGQQFVSSDVAGVLDSFVCSSMKTTSWAGAIRAKLISIVSAGTRMVYSRAGIRQSLLAWLTSSHACTNSFCPNWSRFQEGNLCWNLLHHWSPRVNLGRYLLPIEHYKTFVDFARTARKCILTRQLLKEPTFCVNDNYFLNYVWEPFAQVWQRLPEQGWNFYKIDFLNTSFCCFRFSWKSV